MKKFYFLFLCAGMLQAQTYQNTTPTTPAVDGVNRQGGCGGETQPGVHMSAIEVPISGLITNPSKITVNIDISAKWLGDVVVELITPSGEAITLIRRIGAALFTSCGDSSSFVAGNILAFNSDNTSPINAVAIGTSLPIPAGNYAPTYGTAKFPQHHPGVMSTFLTGKQISGKWRLLIYDYGTGEPTTLNSWQLLVASGATLSTTQAGVFGSDISLKQNPVQDLIKLNVNPNFKSLSLDIYDATGKLVKTENALRNVENVNIDAKELAAGIYILVPTKDGEKKQGIRFVKK